MSAKPVSPLFCAGNFRQHGNRYSEICFAGCREGEELVSYYAAADVFVLPSRTETFGLVLLEAAACGLPVAAFPVPGPIDVIGNSGAGALDWELRRAAIAALSISREACRAHAMRFTWTAATDQFLRHLVPAEPGPEAESATMPASVGGAARGLGVRRWAFLRSRPGGR